MCKCKEYVPFQTGTTRTNPERIYVAINNFQLDSSGFANLLWYAHVHAEIKQSRVSISLHSTLFYRKFSFTYCSAIQKFSNQHVDKRSHPKSNPQYSSKKTNVVRARRSSSSPSGITVHRPLTATRPRRKPYHLLSFRILGVDSRRAQSSRSGLLQSPHWLMAIRIGT